MSNLDQELERFLLSPHRRRASTCETYRAILTQFVRYANDQNVIVAVSDFLSSKKLQPGTHNLYLSAITTFLFERRLISREDRDELNRNRATVVTEPYAKHALDAGDLARFMIYLQTVNAKGNPLRNQRDLAIFALQYACAMRISEVLTLRSDDITKTDTSLYFRVTAERDKTHTERTIPLRYGFTVANINVSAVFNVWRTMSSPLVSTDLVFFNLRKGNLGSPIAVESMIEKYNHVKARLGIVTGRATHALRHTRITELANNRDIPLPVISEFAGHHTKGQPNVRTTSLYIERPKPEDVAKFLG